MADDVHLLAIGLGRQQLRRQPSQLTQRVNPLKVQPAARANSNEEQFLLQLQEAPGALTSCS